MRIYKCIISVFLSIMGIASCSNNNLKDGDKQGLVDYCGQICPDEDSIITTSLFGAFSYSHSIWSSVGYSFRVEYDKTEFDMETMVRYDNPSETEMCGGDSAVKTCVFRPLKKGTFTIKVIHEFRGDVENTITFSIIVK